MMTPGKATTVYVVRHGETTTNLAGTVTGQMDVSLTEKGRQQAEACRDVVLAQNLKIDAVVCSGLNRTKETAGIINASLNLPLFEYSELNEQSYGDWEGRDWNFVSSEIAIHGENPPNGETSQAFSQRVTAALDEVVEVHSGTVLIVTHAGVLGALFSAPRNSGEKIKNGVLYRADLPSKTLDDCR